MTRAIPLDAYRHLTRRETWRQTAWSGNAPVTAEITGAVWSDAIEACLQQHGSAHLPAQDEPYVIDRPIVLASGQRLTADPDARIILKPGSNCCMLRNASVRSGHRAAVVLAEGADRDIEVSGGIWSTLATGAADHGNMRGGMPDHSIPGLHGVLAFHNVHGLRVHDVTIRESRPFGIHVGNARDFRIENIRYEHHQRDGVHVDGPAEDGVIRGICGQCGDDAVALNAWDWENYSVTFGAIRRVAVSDVEITASALPGMHHCASIRVLAGTRVFPSGATLECPVEECSFEHLRGLREIKVYPQKNLELRLAGRIDESPDIGRVRNLAFRDVAIFDRGNAETGIIHVASHADGLAIEQIDFTGEAATVPDADKRLVAVGPWTMTWVTDADGGPLPPERWFEIGYPDQSNIVRGLTIGRVSSGGRPLQAPLHGLVRIVKMAGRGVLE